MGHGYNVIADKHIITNIVVILKSFLTVYYDEGSTVCTKLILNFINKQHKEIKFPEVPSKDNKRK